VFATAALHRYHNQILARFLADHAIDHRWLDETRLEFDHASLRVHGGGRFRADAGHRTLRLYDDSQVYGRFDAGRIARIFPATAHPWSEYTLIVS
jgi:hypothetical protein